jgi:hypothetical protein
MQTFENVVGYSHAFVLIEFRQPRQKRYEYVRTTLSSEVIRGHPRSTVGDIKLARRQTPHVPTSTSRKLVFCTGRKVGLEG